MKNNLCISFFLLGLSLNANALILSFDGVTGVAEAGSTTVANSCASIGDHCNSSLTFANIDGSSIGATVTANSASDLTGTSLFAWYDLQPTGLGGMGAATEANATFPGGDSSQDNGMGGLEYIVVTFTEAVLLDQHWFNGNHSNYDWFSNLWVDGGAQMDTDCVMSVCDNMDIMGTQFVFGAPTGHQFYLSGASFRVPMPEPGILLLFGFGMVAIGLTRRRAT